MTHLKSGGAPEIKSKFIGEIERKEGGLDWTINKLNYPFCLMIAKAVLNILRNNT